jgi:hypothetical protein
MFQEIPSQPTPPSQRGAIGAFAVSFASFLIGSVIGWFRWSGHPLSVSRKIAVGEFIFGLLVSGMFLLTAKAATPEDNRKRLWALFCAIMIIQVIIDVLQ